MLKSTINGPNGAIKEQPIGKLRSCYEALSIIFMNPLTKVIKYANPNDAITTPIKCMSLFLLSIDFLIKTRFSLG